MTCGLIVLWGAFVVDGSASLLGSDRFPATGFVSWKPNTGSPTRRFLRMVPY